MPKQSSRRVSPDSASLRKFRSALRDARKRTHFMYGREVTRLAFELRSALLDLMEGLADPRKGIEAVARFFRSDEALFNMCDDSYGTLGDVFTIDACGLFVQFAAVCDDKKWISEIVFELQLDSDYGVRDCLINAAAQYLPEPEVRQLAEKFWELSGKEQKHGPLQWFYLIKSLARQLHDPQLFRRASLAAFPEGSLAQFIDIAEVYLQSGDAETALEWLNKVPPGEHHRAYERDELLLAVYRKLGRKERAAETAWRIFRRSRHQETLDQLLETIGHENRERLLDEEAELILKSRELNYTDAEYLIWCGKVEEAETYLLSRASQIDGDYYGSVLPLAEAMERSERYLAATVLYRALLESILDRAISKYYGYGVRYLHKLEDLAPLVVRWRSFVPHETYFSNLVERNKRKSSFWGKYEAGRRGRRGDKTKGRLM